MRDSSGQSEAVQSSLVEREKSRQIKDIPERQVCDYFKQQLKRQCGRPHDDGEKNGGETCETLLAEHKLIMSTLDKYLPRVTIGNYFSSLL
jgi:hypothetical protein